MHSQRYGLELELMFKREAEHTSSENLQPDDEIEKKNPFYEEKFKLVAEICISNEEPNVNHQDDAENVSRACQRSSQDSFPSQAQRPKRKKRFHGPCSEPCCFVQSWDSVPGVNIQLRPLLQRVQDPNLGNLHVLGLQGSRSRELRFGNLCLDFRRCINMSGCPGRSLL
uniref:Uncharacterized protein n=1 Tax=Macaca fascicularis TaxID=9541 RepID=A0A7N9IBP2_MACFA